MKLLFTILFSMCTLLAVHPATGLSNMNYIETEDLTPDEAATLTYLWELEKYLRDLYITGSGCSSNPDIASAAIVQQDHMDSLKVLLGYYGMEVPVPGEEVGEFTGPFLNSLYETPEMVWTGLSYLCGIPHNPEPGIYFNAIVYEEFAIWNLLQAIYQAGDQQLLDVYYVLLGDAGTHLKLFASLHPAGWDTPLFISQELLDEIMAGPVPSLEDIVAGIFSKSVDGEFAINPGLNDAWYYSGTDGQGFFISVFPALGTVSLAWFTYDTELPGPGASANLGDPGQRWLIASGPFEGDQAILEVMSFDGGLFDTGFNEPSYEEIGSVILHFEDCNTGSISYDLPGISRSGVIPIERVATDNVPVCEAYK